MWDAWIGHWYPGITPPLMDTLSLSQLVGLQKFAERGSK